MADSERREHTRIDFKHSGEALIELRVVMEIVNLSAGGMGLITNLPIEPGSMCNLVLFQGNLSVQSNVVSCTRIPRRKMRFQVGTRFTKVSAQLLEEVLEMEKRFKSQKIAFSSHLEEGEVEIAVLVFPATMAKGEWEVGMKMLQNHLDEGVRKFVFDFAKVGKVENPFMENLLTMDEEIGFEEGQLVLANCSSQLLSSLTVSQLGSSISIFESLERALQSLRSGRIDIRDKE